MTSNNRNGKARLLQSYEVQKQNKCGLCWRTSSAYISGSHFPTLPTCLPVQGVSGQPGCVRYCAGIKTPVDRESDRLEHVNWSKQQLLSIDPSQLTYSYSIIDGNIGFNSYIAAIRVLPKEDGCSIEWKYEVEPIEGWTLMDLDMLIGPGLQLMARKMEASLDQYKV